MKEKGINRKLSPEKLDDKNTKGYPLYPNDEDIYKKDQEEKDIDPEDISKNKDFYDDRSDNDLDIPGSELDDEQEDIGSEDEENNYYSLGGDDHNDLDEDDG